VLPGSHRDRPPGPRPDRRPATHAQHHYGDPMASLSSIYIYPDRDEPAQELEQASVSAEGLDGDRRKKSPVHLVSVEDYVTTHPRANLVVDVDTADLAALVGRRVRIGSVELDVTGSPSSCPGVYAVVPVPGNLAVGDEVTAAGPPAPV